MFFLPLPAAKKWGEDREKGNPKTLLLSRALSSIG
jgi:hypothetical protein